MRDVRVDSVFYQVLQNLIAHVVFDCKPVVYACDLRASGRVFLLDRLCVSEETRCWIEVFRFYLGCGATILA